MVERYGRTMIWIVLLMAQIKETRFISNVPAGSRRSRKPKVLEWGKWNSIWDCLM